jgi:hypothetical protein
LTRRAGSYGPLNTCRTRALRCRWGPSACLCPSSSTRQNGWRCRRRGRRALRRAPGLSWRERQQVKSASAKCNEGPGQHESRKERLAVDHRQNRVRAAGPRGGGRDARVLQLVGAARARAHDGDVCLDTAAAAQRGRVDGHGEVGHARGLAMLRVPASGFLGPKSGFSRMWNTCCCEHVSCTQSGCARMRPMRAHPLFVFGCGHVGVHEKWCARMCHMRAHYFSCTPRHRHVTTTRVPQTRVHNNTCAQQHVCTATRVHNTKCCVL